MSDTSAGSIGGMLSLATTATSAKGASFSKSASDKGFHLGFLARLERVVAGQASEQDALLLASGIHAGITGGEDLPGELPPADLVGPQKTAGSVVIGLVPKLGTRSAVQDTSAKIIGDSKLVLSEEDRSPIPSYLEPNAKVNRLAALPGVLQSEITTVDKSGTSDLETLGAALEHTDQPAAPVDKADGVYTTAKNPGVARSIAGVSQGAIVLDVPLNDQRWGEAFASRVVWQVGEKIQQAQVRINPPDLGPIEVRISVERDQASVQFTAQHGLVREVIEDALPRLREMLSQSGLHLADANVSQQSAGNEHQGSEYLPSEDPQFIEETEVSTYGDAIGSSQPTVHRGLIDVYA